MAIKKAKFINNMPKVIAEIDHKAGRAVYAAATVLDAYQATNVPIDTSALANNRSIELKQSGTVASATLKFHQSYAAAVHAKVGVNWKRPDAIDQWLSKSAEGSRDDMQSAIAGVMKL